MLSVYVKFKQSALAQALLATGICLAIYGIGPISFFETNDDVGYSLIVSGKLIANSPDPHVVFINYALAKLFVILYTFMPEFQWYGFFHVASIFSAIFYINYIFNLKNNKINIWITIVLSIICILPFSLQIQFTKTAFILSAAGFLGLCIFSETDLSRKQGLFINCTSILFVLTGFFVRKESFFLATLLFSVFLADTLKNKIYSRKFIFSLILLIIAFAVVDKINYKKDWGNFIDLSKKIEPFMEKEVIKFSENRSIFYKIGWSQNDFLMLKTWAYVNSEIYNRENLEYIINNSKKEKISINIGNSLMQSLGGSARNYIYTMIIFSIAILLIYNFSFSKLLFYIIIPLAVVVIIISSQGRLPPRVSMSVACFLPLAILSISTGIRLSRPFFVMGTIASFFIVLPAYGQYLDIDKFAKGSLIQNKELHELGSALSGKNFTIVTWGASFPYEGILPFERLDYIENANLISFGGFNQSPIQEDMLRYINITDIFFELSTNDTFFISMNQFYVPILKKYYQEHYDFDVNIEPVYRSRNMELYKIIKKI